MEAKSFPSDYVRCDSITFPFTLLTSQVQYAIESQLKFHGYHPAESIIQITPLPNEHILRTEDILRTIEKEGDSVALVLFSGVQYYTGQFFELDKIAAAGKAKVGIGYAWYTGKQHKNM